MAALNADRPEQSQAAGGREAPAAATAGAAGREGHAGHGSHRREAPAAVPARGASPEPRTPSPRRTGRLRMLRRMIWRTVKGSKGRFLSIVGLMALGSFALVGLKVAGPDMRAAGSAYFNDLNAADITVIGDYGLTDEDAALIEQVSGLRQVEYGYLKDVVIGGTNASVRVQSAPEEVSRYEVASGRMPEAADEIALDSAWEDDYALGDTVALTEKADARGNTVLKRDSFTVVGFVNSAEIVSQVTRGESTAGSGELDGYAVVDKSAFDSDVYMTARLTFDDTADLDPYSDAYDDAVHAHRAQLQDLLAGRGSVRLAEVRADGQQTIDEGQREVDSGKQELADARDQLADARAQLDDGAARITQAEGTLADALAAARGELASGQAQITAGKAELADARQQLADKSAQLDAAWAQINAGQQAYDNGAAELAAQQRVYDEGVAAAEAAACTLASQEEQYSQGCAQAEEARSQIAAGEKDLADQQADLDAKSQQLEAGKSGYADAASQSAAAADGAAARVSALEDQIAEVQAQLAQEGLADDERAQLENQAAQLAADLDAARQAQEQAEAACAQAQAAYEAYLEDTYNPGAAQIAAGQEQLDAAAARLAASKDELAAKESQLAAAADALDQGRAQLAAVQGQLEDAAAQLTDGRATLAASGQRLSQARLQAQDGAAQLEAARAQAASAADLLAQKEAELAAGYQAYAATSASYEEQLDAARAELAQQEKAYQEALDAYNREAPGAEEDIARAEADLAEAREKLAKMAQPSYSLYGRREVPGGDGYAIYQTVSEIVDALANVFPIFLYFVAALVTFTTMTRMVDEERINTGTLKALGYGDAEVMRVFLVYGFAASTLGSLAGIIAGHTVLPLIVYAAYGAKFSLPAIALTFDPAVSAIALALGYASAVLPAYLSAKRELLARPADLLLPKPPADGSKILLERITPVWSRLSFTHKVTARNIFRYKKRMLMTIFGVAGAVVLLVAGFGTQYSISGISDEQFGRLVNYDMIVAESATATDAEKEEVAGLLASDEVTRTLPVYYENVTCAAGARGDEQDITVIVPDDPDELAGYITLQERVSGAPIAFDDDAAVLSERIADLMGVGVGDTFTVTDAGGMERTLTCTGVAEMYMGHFLFVGKAAYQEAFGAPYAQNAHLVTLADGSLDNVNHMASSFMELPGVEGIQQNTSLITMIATIVDSLNMIMVVLIIVASMLAIVILYNLTTINVSERIRELSTIKVLGFFDKEVTLYIYRETILLTLIGIVVGWVMGVWFRNYIITVVPPDNVMFDPSFAPYVFAIPLVIVSAITAVLGLVVHRRLRDVDMLQALKSVE